MVTLAVAGNVVARLIPKVDAGAPALKVNWNPIPESRAVLRLARRQLAVRNAILEADEVRAQRRDTVTA